MDDTVLSAGPTYISIGSESPCAYPPAQVRILCTLAELRKGTIFFTVLFLDDKNSHYGPILALLYSPFERSSLKAVHS